MPPALPGGSASGAAGGPKSLPCEFPGCTKVFTRKDHLIRHAANHAQPNYHCSTCGRSFQRLDLLQRHERRQICDDERYPKRPRRDSSATSVDGLPASGGSNPQPPPVASTSAAVHGTPVPPLPSQLPGGLDPASSSGLISSVQQFAGGDNGSLYSNPLLAGSVTTTQQHAQQQALLDYPAESGDSVVFDSADFGFHLWPPDPWEALLHDALPPLWDESTAPELNWNLDALLGQQGVRAQESAERGSSGAGPSGGTSTPGMTVDAAVHARVLGTYPELDLGIPELTEALGMYWTHVAPSFPFVHRGTFDLETAPEELIVMMAVGGFTQRPAPRPPRDDRALVRRIRARLLEDRFGLDMQLPTLQAYTLCHMHDVWYGDAESLFTAQCLWPVASAHSRKQGIGVTGIGAPGGRSAAAWAAWAKDEERRRAAYCILLLDTQISAFWSQHPSRQLSIFAHNLNLPAPRALWEAPTAESWLRAREAAANHDNPSPGATTGRRPRAGYLPGLHPEFQVSAVSEGYSSAVLSALAAEGNPPIRIDVDNSLSVTLVLIGLAAVAWDCRTRGGMGIRFRDGAKHWRGIVLNAVVSLRAAYELGVTHVAPCPETRDVRDTLALCIISILSDIPMLQVAAGATSICGASIGPKQYADGKRRLRLWATTPDAWTCLWQSARYLREALHADWGIYSPWAVFLTTLVVWAYASALSRDELSPISDNAAAAASALLDSIYGSPTRVEHLDAGVSDLIVTVAARLESKGERIDVENAALLWRLASRR